MYKHYETSDDIFVDREEYIDWMKEALERCKENPVVLHLKGIGGIGKSSLLEHWMSTNEEAVRLDCETYTEFYQRLNVLAKGTVLTGAYLPRFDVLWQIRQRFVEGVEPVKEEGREWARDVVMAIPFIGSLASIGNAINAVGKKVAPKLKGKYGDLGTWLQDRLGKDHVERLLEILWKEPRRAEFLYLDALLEDINNRKTIDIPIIFLLDHYEYVDTEHPRWRYSGKQITESELWRVFLSSLKNCVGVMASRRAATETKDMLIEESELTELDKESCIELLELRGIKDSNIQERIVSVTGGNPFVIGTICDMNDSGKLSLEALEGLRADTLEEVRLKTWRRLFREAQELLPFVDRIGLLPFFNRKILNVIVPDLKTDQWDRLQKLSFVKERDDETWVLHDLAEELVRVELGDRLHVLANEVIDNLEKAHAEEPDFTLIGLAISVQALVNHDGALRRLYLDGDELLYLFQLNNVRILLNAVKIDTFQGRATVRGMKGFLLASMQRVADGVHILEEVLEMSEEMTETDQIIGETYTAMILHWLGRMYSASRRIDEAEQAFKKSISMFRKLDEKNLGSDIIGVPFEMVFSGTILFHGVHKIGLGQLEDAKASMSEAESMMMRYFESLDVDESDFKSSTGSTFKYFLPFLRNRLAVAHFLSGDVEKAEEMFRDVKETAERPMNKMAASIWICEILRLTDRLAEAEEMYLEEKQQWNEVIEKDPNYKDNLATCLNNLGSTVLLAGRHAEAETGYSESLGYVREFMKHDPDSYRAALAWTLRDLGVILRQSGKLNDAKKIHEEAVEVSEQLTQETELSHDRLAVALNNIAVFLREIGDASKARESLLRALKLARNEWEEKPDAVFIKQLVPIILNNIGLLDYYSDKLEEANSNLQEAYKLQKELAEEAPSLFTSYYSSILNNLGVVHHLAGDTKKGEKYFMEALEYRMKLAKKSSDQYSLDLASTYYNLSLLQKYNKKSGDSDAAMKKALGILAEIQSKPPLFENRIKGLKAQFDSKKWLVQEIEIINPPLIA